VYEAFSAAAGRRTPARFRIISDLNVSSYCYIRVLILLRMYVCAHTTCSYYCMRQPARHGRLPHTAARPAAAYVCVLSYCMLIPLYAAAGRAAAHPAAYVSSCYYYLRQRTRICSSVCGSSYYYMRQRMRPHTAICGSRLCEQRFQQGANKALSH
jgi:hypothetical protein